MFPANVHSSRPATGRPGHVDFPGAPQAVAWVAKPVSSPSEAAGRLGRPDQGEAAAYWCEYMSRPGTGSSTRRIEPVSDSVMYR